MPYLFFTPHLLFDSPLLFLRPVSTRTPRIQRSPILASLGSETKAKEVYPEDYYAGGAYLSLPFGNVRPFPYPYLTAFSITHRGNCAPLQ